MPLDNSYFDNQPNFNNNNNNHIFPVDRPKIFWPVAKEKMVSISGRESDRIGLWRTDREDNNFLGVHSEKYGVIENRELIENLQNQIVNSISPEYLKDIKVTDYTSFNGAVIFSEYIFPNLSEEIGNSRNTSKVSFRIIVKNSFDGSSGIRLIIGNIDMFCMNGQITGNFDVVSKKHTSRIKVDDITKRLKQGVEKFREEMVSFNWFAKHPIANTKAYDFFTKLFVSYDQETGEEKSGVSKRDRTYNQYLAYEVPVRGNNVWSAVSALSAISSDNSEYFAPRKTGKDHYADTIVKNQLQVGAWLQTEAFKELTLNVG